MLIMRNLVRGRCPVCGAIGAACGGPSDVVPVDERVVVAASKGPLLTFQLGRGVSIRLREETAKRRGLLPPKPDPAEKRRPAPSDKARRPGSNK